MDYGENLQFKRLTFVLLNKETFPDTKFYMVARMYGTKVTILDDEDNVVYVACEDFQNLSTHLSVDTVADQTYKMELGGVMGRKVKFATQQIGGKIHLEKRIQIVESWVDIVSSDYGNGKCIGLMFILRTIDSKLSCHIEV